MSPWGMLPFGLKLRDNSIEQLRVFTTGDMENLLFLNAKSILMCSTT